MNLWSRAAELAAQTPAERNRYVDFLRAVSILFVIVGHWLIATAWYHDGTLLHGHLLESHPGFHWLTWLFQVMPIFFIVGGYSNAVSLESARRDGAGYAEWLIVRLHRLALPLVALLVAWALIALVLRMLGVAADTVQFVSRSSLIPTWFLAIYIMLVILAPAAYAAWRRLGFLSFWILAALGVLTDVAFFAAGQEWLGWSNYFWVWLAVHQLGFAWRDGRQGSPLMLLGIAAAAFIALYLLIFEGPYPLAMVGSPDEDVSNTLPPKITLLALGLVQFGVLLAIEAPLRRLLAGSRIWTATVLINSMIMTVYLWHMTVMAAFVTVLYYLGGIGLGFEPGSPAWWYSRPAWIVVLLALLLPSALPLSSLERIRRPAGVPAPPAVRQVIGSMLLCLGVAWIALYGYLGGPVPRGDVIALALVIGGAALIDLAPRFATRP